MARSSAIGSRLNPSSGSRPATLNWLGIVLGLFVLTSTNGISQVPHSYPGSVEGRITCNDSGLPARNAHVSLVSIDSLNDPSGGSQTPSFQSNAQTDFNGDYVIPGIPAGEYLIWVRQAGYINEVALAQHVLKFLSSEQQKAFLAGLPQVSVRNGRSRADIVIHRGGVISGRVTFPDGGALDGARMNIVLVSGAVIGEPKLGGGEDTTFEESTLGLTTDDRGSYRIAGLPKGVYRISLRDRGVQIFPPGTTKESEAKLVSIDEGDEASDIDIVIPVQLFHSISGIVTRDGIPTAHAYVTISRQGERATYGGGETLSDGLYSFPMQLSGNYVVEAQYPAESPQIKTKITVRVGESDVPDANIDLRSHRRQSE
jgi:hypothetical protein